MKNRKINVDRPHLTSNEVMASKNFGAVLSNHQIMVKPFYKQNWFFGTTGLASIGLIIGGTVAFQNSSDENQVSELMMLTDAPPNLVVPDNNILALQVRNRTETSDLIQKTIQINPLTIAPIEETNTLKEENQNNIDQKTVISTDIQMVENDLEDKPVDELVVAEEGNVEKDGTRSLDIFDIYPRISSKMGGSISRNELLDNKGITTEGDVSIIHFELHLIDGLGGRIFEEESNQLNQDMKDALENVGKGETIYFENIRGKVKNGTEVRLNPLRYVLMN